MTRQSWIEPAGALPIQRQCVLAGVTRSGVYARRQPKAVAESDLRVSALIDEQYTKRPFYGSRKMVVFLARAGCVVNRKRVQRLMRLMGLAGMAPGKKTSQGAPGHKIYPYLLRGVPVLRPNQVWR